MNLIAHLDWLVSVELGLSFLGVICLLWKRQARHYSNLLLLAGWHALFGIYFVILMNSAGHIIEAHLAYKLYFCSYWVGFCVEAFLGLLLIQSIFNLALRPLDGIRMLGRLVFRWAASVSALVAFASVLIPHTAALPSVATLVTELQRAQSVLTLCLLLFVSYAIRPLGLTFSSRPFGVLLGLGVLAAANLLSLVWQVHFHALYSTVNAAHGLANCVGLLIWVLYFALPEPKRRIVVLPTTSPFLRWNQVSEALGDEPGFVAVGGVPPELFAPAELAMLRAASMRLEVLPSRTPVPSAFRHGDQARTA